MRRIDEAEEGEEVVRAFMVTGGKTRAADELPIETLVSPVPNAASIAPGFRFERRQIVEGLAGPTSIAEIAAHLKIPLRASVVIVSELVAENALRAHAAVQEIDVQFLLRIRAALDRIK